MQFLLSRLAWLFYRGLTLTWRIHYIEHPDFLRALERHEPVVLAHWHGEELALLHLMTRYRASTMTSTSKDGELMNAVILKLGGKTSRGSSSRGGTRALKGLIRLIREGHPASIAVDGPKGPIHEPKPGVFEIARIAGAPIHPVAAYVSRPHIFEKSWNKAVLPKPFSRITIVVDTPLPPPGRHDDPRSAELALSLKSRLAEAGRRAAESRPFEMGGETHQP